MLVKKQLYKDIPESPGVYIMRDTKGNILYVGKAANLRRRVLSYFTRPHDVRIEKMVSGIDKIDFKKTESALEALILESKLIKKHEPPFNIREKDGKSFLYIEITDEDFPRVILLRGKEKAGLGRARRFGPFVSGGNAREALRVLRRIFPFNTHSGATVGKSIKPCFEYELGLCPGTCIGVISEKEYKASIKNLIRFLRGEKKALVRELSRKMNSASIRLDFETAAKFRRQIFALKHIQDIAFINNDELRSPIVQERRHRIEGYDISNISGTSAVGSMVVFSDDDPIKSEYRKFKINAISGPDDVGMLREILTRRLRNHWPLPDLILIDGGKPQVNAAKVVLNDSGIGVPVIGIAKGPERKKNEFIGSVPQWVSETTLIRVRNEAHRFAIKYHRLLRGRLH